MPDRGYGLIRGIVERRGGAMTYEKKGHRYGAWIISIGERRVCIESAGARSFPELDRLYVPRVSSPACREDYIKELVPDAESRLLRMLEISPSAGPADFSDDEVKELSLVIARAKWQFAWTYARTCPHEYTTRKRCAPEDHGRLIDCIERYGITGRFGKSYRKYFYFQERKYWHMGEPCSDNPEKQPNVINRAWTDVRRHAANVKHSWTDEEIELQVRLWEIQLARLTDDR